MKAVSPSTYLGIATCLFLSLITGIFADQAKADDEPKPIRD